MSLKDVLSSTGYAQDVVVNASCNPKTGHYSAYDLIQFLDENIETFMVRQAKLG